MQKNEETSRTIQFSDIFDLNDIQHIQDLFADATGVASIITHPDGTPITRPSNFCRLCNEIIRKTDSGLSNCFKSDAEIGRPNPEGPVIQPCLSGGLWDAGASIIVGGIHIANWLIGQVKNEELDSQQMLKYSKEIGSDQDEFMNALEAVPVMSKEKFEKVADMLFAFASEISSKAYQNSQLKQVIEERSRAEKESTQKQYLINSLLDNLPDHIYFKDRESRFIRINKSMAKFLNLEDPDQAIGKKDSDFFTIDHARQSYADEQNIIKTGQSLNIEELETYPDRSDTWVSTIKMPLRDDEGKINGTFGISRDITKSKLAEEELMKSEILNRTLIKHLPQRIFVKDPESRYILCNEIYSKDLGIDPKEIVGKDDFAFFDSELAEKFRTDDQQVISEGIQKEFEEKYSISNQRRWTHVNKVPYRDANNQIVGVLGIFEDITERKLREEEIILKNGLLQAMNEEKDKFFSIIAHDLRSPLSAFISVTQILTEEIQTMNIEEIKKFTLSMKISATNIYSLLENLLDWSRLRQEGLDFVPERLNLNEKVNDCIDVLSESARKKGILINVSIPGEIEISADNHMFDTIIRNLVSNAIKFTPAGGNISVTAEPGNDHTIDIKIIDSGIGMTPELKRKLFLLNEKTSRKGTEGEPSTGLGLLLCKEFIEKHGGKIWVESEVGKGSTFFINIEEFKDKVI
jgi:two-component system, sensor histidine kinase and response regulator